jgi:hypothetical protein
MGPRIRVTLFDLERRALVSAEFASFPVVIGREQDCHLRVPNELKQISRHHAKIDLSGETLKVFDLKSRYGVFQKGQRGGEFPISADHDGQLTEFSLADFVVAVEILSRPEPAEATLGAATALAMTQITELDTVYQPNESVTVDPPTFTPPPTVKPAAKSHPAPTPLEARGEDGLDTVVEIDEKTGIIALDKTFTNISPGSASVGPDSIQRESPGEAARLQGFITWNNDLYDVRLFQPDEPVLLSPTTQAALTVPVLKSDLLIGQAKGREATFLIPSDLPFWVYENNSLVSNQALIDEGRARVYKDQFRLKLRKQTVLAIELIPGVRAQFRMVPEPPQVLPYIPYQWTKEAIASAGLMVAVHLAILFLIFLAPGPTDLPKIENVPERTVRLLFEDVPPPPPEPEPTPVATPPPTPAPTAAPTAAPKPTPKPTPKLEPKPKPTPKPKPVVEAPPQPKPVVAAPPAPKPQQVTRALPQRPPPETTSTVVPAEPDESADLLAALGGLSDTPAAKPSGSAPAAGRRVVQGPSGGPTNRGVSVDNLRAGSRANTSSDSLGGALGSAPSGFAQPGVKSQAGRRRIEGQVVGRPQISSQSQDNGLTEKQIMDVVQKATSRVQQCYERSLMDQSDLAGRAEYEWDISPQGVVIQTRVRSSELSGPGATGLHECVQKAIRALKFPTASSGRPTTAKIGFPFGKL